MFSLVDLPLIFQFASPGPILVQWGSFAIRWYGFLIASAVLLGVTLSQYLVGRRNFKSEAMRDLTSWLVLIHVPRIRLDFLVNLSQSIARRRRNLHPEIISDLAIWLVLAAIPSARLYYVLFQRQTYIDDPIEVINLWNLHLKIPSVFAIWKGGIAIHGAVLGGLVASLIFCRIKRISFWQMADLVAPALILGQAIGRWGNFFNSEAFGRPTDLPWKLYIPPERRPPGYEGSEYFHPTFLYESLWNLMVFAILMRLFFWGLKPKSNLKSGTLFLTYLVAYSCGRFWIEGLRTDSLMLGPLRIAQVVSLVQIAVGILGLVWLYGLQRSLPDVVSVQAEADNSETSPQSDRLP